jgi:hypothetical protein
MKLSLAFLFAVLVGVALAMLSHDVQHLAAMLPI